MITHTVLLKLVDPVERDEVKARLEALPATIREIRSLTVGLDVVGTPASYDLCLSTTVDSLVGLKAYLDHPDHQEFIEWLRPRLSARAVVDAES